MKASRNIRPTLLPVARADEVKPGYLEGRMPIYEAEVLRIAAEKLAHITEHKNG